MTRNPWPDIPLNFENFRRPPRDYGILPFWFLNGELDPEEMRYQLREFREQGMPGIILHGRYGLEMPYIGPKYLDRIRFAIEEAEKLGLQTWIYDEMNWPSGTADKRVLKERPDLAERYIECVNVNVRGPWFTYLTGADSRYNDFERSTPVAAFALKDDGQVVDLTPNLSFTNVIPWEAPEGNWRLIYIVEKEADYYIDAFNPETTAEFLRIGYEPYREVAGSKFTSPMLGFYTDEPAMHYYLTAGDNPVVPWTKDMFRRFQERNGYNLRPRLPDLFFDVSPDSARVRYDFYTTLTEFYSEAFYRQIHEWCQRHNVVFTGHLLYEEWLRKLIRVEGNVFKHYPHMDVIGVDHLYPIIGDRDRPDEHVAMKVGSSAAHQLGSPRLLCESFGGIFMDATMQRMKWIADWEYVLGVNLLNPHGYHYTLEGPRKRDWPPSMFYQYPWWRHYRHFSDYMSRLSHLLSGGRHVAKVAMLWPMNAMFATYTPQAHNALGDRIEHDFNALTDLFLRHHYDFDYLDEDVLADASQAQLDGNTVRVADEAYELLVVPPMAHIKLSTLERLEQFVAQGGRVLGAVFLPTQAFGPDGLTDVAERVSALFGVDAAATLRYFATYRDVEVVEHEHAGGGRTAFLRSYAIARRLPMRLQEQLRAVGRPESPHFVVDAVEGGDSRYYYAPAQGERQDITTEVQAERQAVSDALGRALTGLCEPDIVIDNPEILYLHRVKDGRDLYFLVNSTSQQQTAQVALSCEVQPVLWDPSQGEERVVAPLQVSDGRTRFNLALPPIGSVFILTEPAGKMILTDTNITIESYADGRISGYGATGEAYAVVQKNGTQHRVTGRASKALPEPLVLDGEWEFETKDANALIVGEWQAAAERPGTRPEDYTGENAAADGWLPMVPGAWSYQLPAEPAQPYPIAVWYRIPFRAGYVPPKLELIVDGFAGTDWQLYVNGRQPAAGPVRSQIDAQMKAVDITDLVREGDNLIALRLTLAGPTDGLTDLIKLMGHFSVLRGSDGTYEMVRPQPCVQPASWTGQGYPFFSGQAVYRQRFRLPEAFAGRRVFLEPVMADDVLEVVVNGRPAGVRLWAPYTVDISDFLQPGENTLELWVANTLVNLLEATERPSGLAAAPRLVAYERFELEVGA